MELKSADELQQLLNQAEADKVELQTRLDHALAANDALTFEIEMLTSATSKTPAEKKETVIKLDDYSFEHDGVKYGFNYGKLSLKGNVITPVEVVADKALQKHLVESKTSMLKEI